MTSVLDFTNCRRRQEGIVDTGRWDTKIAIANTRWPLGFLVKREKKRAIPGKRKIITRRPSQIRGQPSSGMVNPYSTNVLGLWHTNARDGQRNCWGKKIREKNKEPKPDNQRGTRASVV